MQKLFSRLSIQSKLTLIIFMSCTFLLLIVSSILAVVEFYANRTMLTQEVQTLATSLAANSSRPLVLGKYTEIEEVLTSLDQQKNIHAAYVFDHEGKPVAEYLNQQNSQFVIAAIQRDFKDGRLPGTNSLQPRVVDLTHFSFFQPVFFQEKAAGTLYILSDLSSFYARLSAVAAGIIASFIVLLFCSWLLARRVQKPISGPLLQLTEIMNLVSEQQNFSLRAEKNSRDEVGVLVDGFNHMLEQIEKQRGKLAQHQHHLEKMVTERTAELGLTVDKLERARKRADAANAAKSDFLSKMTHELRTPLIGVLGMNELLQRTSLDDQQTMLTETVHKSGEELLRLINDVLDLSRIEAGRLTLEPVAVDLHKVVEDVVELLLPQAQSKKLYLSVEMPLETAWKVYSDQGRIRQVLLNLIGNAIKFTSSGGVTVTVEIEQKTDQEALFVIAVADTGIGIDEKVKDQIFDVFYQVDGAGTRQNNGSGLGLAIVKQLVDLMNGELSFNSTPGQGSCFQIKLSFPLVEKVDHSLPAELSGKRVLLCCDHQHYCHEIKRRLQELKFNVDIALGGSEGFYRLLAAARQGEPYGFAFIGSDVELETGQKMYEALGSKAELQTLRIILLSSHRGENVLSSSAEKQLFFPLRWSGLCTTICHSWKSLHILPKIVSVDVERESQQKQDSLLLIGYHVASRELLRLSLLKHFPKVVVAGNLQDAEKLIGESQFSGVCIDYPYIPRNELLTWLKKHVRLLSSVVLFADENLDDETSFLNCLHVLKPVDKDIVESQIKPYLQITPAAHLDGGV